MAMQPPGKYHDMGIAGMAARLYLCSEEFKLVSHNFIT